MRTTKLSRIDRCMSLLFEVKHLSSKGQKINNNDLCNENGIDVSLLRDAQKTGFISKNGNGFVFNKPITPDNVIKLLEYNHNKKQEYRRIKEAKREIELQNTQVEICNTPSVPDISVRVFQTECIDQENILERLVFDFKNLWIKLNEYAKTQKP